MNDVENGSIGYPVGSSNIPDVDTSISFNGGGNGGDQMLGSDISAADPAFVGSSGAGSGSLDPVNLFFSLCNIV